MQPQESIADKIIRTLREDGMPGVAVKVKNKISYYLLSSQQQKKYRQWRDRVYPSAETIQKERQRSLSSEFNPLISVLLPVFNPNLKHLRECIDSVLAQSYPHWELCIVDDCSNEEVRDVLTKYSSQDKRIKLHLRKTNGHICKATNDALMMAAGEWVSLMDHDDLLWPNALFEVVRRIESHPSAVLIYTDEDKIAEDDKTFCDPFFKPDWSPHFLWSCNYITHFTTLKRSVVKNIGGFSIGTEGAQDWDLFLRVAEVVNAYDYHPWQSDCPIQHIPNVLYTWRKSITSTSSEKHAKKAKSYAYDAQRVVLQRMIDSRGSGRVRSSKYLGIWEVLPALKKNPLVSIVIPTKDNLTFLTECINSIRTKTSYNNIEIIIVDTNSKKSETWNYYSSLGDGIKVHKYSAETFNYATAVNQGANAAKGEYLVFLNDDTEVVTPNWIEEMLAYAQLPEVGTVGCRLLYPSGKIQHTGLIFGLENGKVLGEQGFVSNYYRLADPNKNYGISSILIDAIRDYTAVTAACLMISKNKHLQIKGFDESYAIAFNDVDYCLKLNQHGLYNLVLPQVVLTHHESVSVGRPDTQSRDLDLFAREIANMRTRWHDHLDTDSFLGRHYSLENGLLTVGL